MEDGAMTTVAVFSLTIAPPPEAINRLHRALLTHGRIRDVLSEIPYSYIVKCETDTTAGQLADIVSAPLPGAKFFVAQLHPERIAGFLSDAAREWMEAPAPPPRSPDHEPDAEAILRLPMLAGLEYAATIRRHSERLLHHQTEGHA
jgi:hypothetical protein